MRLCRAVSPASLLSRTQAEEIIDRILATVHDEWNDVCDRAELTRDERATLWGREFCNPYVFDDVFYDVFYDVFDDRA